MCKSDSRPYINIISDQYEMKAILLILSCCLLLHPAAPFPIFFHKPSSTYKSYSPFELLKELASDLQKAKTYLGPVEPSSKLIDEAIVYQETMWVSQYREQVELLAMLNYKPLHPSPSPSRPTTTSPPTTSPPTTSPPQLVNNNDPSDPVVWGRAAKDIGLMESLMNKGSFQHVCKPGYEGFPPATTCKDVDECGGPENVCGDHSQCVNIEGSFYCICESGFEGNAPQTPCSDVNECDINPHLCGYNALCENTPGSFLCSCENGYKGFPPHSRCRDVNECHFAEKICGEHSQCVNMLGSYKCSCQEGFEGSPPTEPCSDIDECLEVNTCGVNAECVNTVPGYQCVCSTGHTGNATVECVPGVEIACAEDEDCTAHAACFTCCDGRCHCLQGFVQQETLCVDIDECSLGISTCDVNTDCHNYEGGYNCTCSEGFEGKPPEVPCTLLQADLKEKLRKVSSQ